MYEINVCSKNNFKEENIMENNQKIICGVVVKSHPKSHIHIINSLHWHQLFHTDEPKRNDKLITVLQVAPLSANDIIVEFVYNEDYTDDLKSQL